ncbi:MAG TPA: aromatic hydrocarbon degradation protein [Porphyromonadaceae bacterium]|nr:aromatic hydrocarbon degradation protein [Porphyromonadaceae bacterium]
MKKLVALVSASFISFSAMAEGYQVNLQSAKQAGMGHVGVAMPLGAESMHFNPAGLTTMKGSIDLSAGASGVFTNIEYQNGDIKAKTDNGVSTPMYAYAGFRIYDNLAAGISVTTPYGSGLNWGKDWVGAHLIQDINLKSFSIQPTIAYRPIEGLSFGAGLMIMTGDVAISRALLPKGALGPLNPDLKDVVPVSASLSGKAKIGVGFNVGVMYDINEKFTVGASYRSKVKMKVNEGTAELSYASEAIKKLLEASGKVPPLDQGTFAAQMPMPSNFNIGVTYRPTDRLTVSGEVQFVGWAAYDSLNIKFSENVLGGYDIKAEKNYKNTRIYRIGTEYKTTERLDLRLGAYFDESPVRSDLYNPETPGMNKLGLTCGFSFRPIPRLSIDGAFTYTHGFKRHGSYPDPASPGTVFEGDYKVSAYTPTLGLSYTF